MHLFAKQSYAPKLFEKLSREHKLFHKLTQHQTHHLAQVGHFIKAVEPEYSQHEQKNHHALEKAS
jgi:hypothetical protein